MDRQVIEDYMREIHIEIGNYIRTIYPNYTCDLMMSWAANRVSSRGGIYKGGVCKVNYAMIRLQERIQHNCFLEYKSFEKDFHIGSIYSENYKDICLVLSCHEQAHAALGFIDRNNKARHGQRWKELYKKLRDNFVNYNETVKHQFIFNYTPNKEELFTQERKDFEKYKDDYKLSYLIIDDILVDTYNSKEYRLAGLNKRARKYPVFLIQLETNTLFKFPAEYIRNFMQLKKEYNKQ